MTDTGKLPIPGPRRNSQYKAEYAEQARKLCLLGATDKVIADFFAANLLKAQLKLKGIIYGQLVEKLEAIGVCEKEANIRNKLSRGKFSAAFFLQCLSAIETSVLQLE